MYFVSSLERESVTTTVQKHTNITTLLWKNENLACLCHYMMVMVGDMVNGVIGQQTGDFLQIGSGLKYVLCSCQNIADTSLSNEWIYSFISPSWMWLGWPPISLDRSHLICSHCLVFESNVYTSCSRLFRAQFTLGDGYWWVVFTKNARLWILSTFFSSLEVQSLGYDNGPSIFIHWGTVCELG